MLHKTFPVLKYLKTRRLLIKIRNYLFSLIKHWIPGYLTVFDTRCYRHL